MEFLSDACAGAFICFEWWKYCGISFCIYLEFWVKKEAVSKVMSVVLIEPFDRWFLSLSKGSETTRRNDCYTKCGGFDKLNHRNANLLDSSFLFMSQFIELYKCSAFYLERNSDYLFYVLLDEIHFQIFKFFCDRNFVDVRI